MTVLGSISQHTKGLKQETQLPDTNNQIANYDGDTNTIMQQSVITDCHQRRFSNTSSSSNHAKLFITSAVVEGHRAFLTEQDCHLHLSSAASCSSSQNNDGLIIDRRKEQITFSSKPEFFNDETHVGTDLRKQDDTKKELHPARQENTFEIEDTPLSTEKLPQGIVSEAESSRSTPPFQSSIEMNLDAIQPDILHQSDEADIVTNVFNEAIIDPSLKQEQKPQRR